MITEDDRIADSYAYITNHSSTGVIHCITGAPNGTNMPSQRFSTSTSSGMMGHIWTRVEEVRTVALPKARRTGNSDRDVICM